MGESNYENEHLQRHHSAEKNKQNQKFQERTLNNSEHGRRDVKEKDVRKKKAEVVSFLQRNKAHLSST